MSLRDLFENQVLQGSCRDTVCNSTIYYLPNQDQLECTRCGQTFPAEELCNPTRVPREQVDEAASETLTLIHKRPSRPPDTVKVLGFSNFHCKLLSPLLTRYGMVNETGETRLLKDMPNSRSDTFSCDALCHRAFRIDPKHIPIRGFGRDVSGSLEYLESTLKLLTAANENEERLVPIHADGDGHCLVHALSRALVGRELFWHPLRICLKKHFQENLVDYKAHFSDFIDKDDWPFIIEECDPDFKPPEGEFHGLRNIHVFGFANVLKRPIILIDSIECMSKSGDYSGVFLPGFISPEECKHDVKTAEGKVKKEFNHPIIIAWSSRGHNHYIPLVGVKGTELPVYPKSLMPKVWGMDQSFINMYMEFDGDKCVIGGQRTLSEMYIRRLISAMNRLYFEKNRIHPVLISDAKIHFFSENPAIFGGIAGLQRFLAQLIDASNLYRCLRCNLLCKGKFDVESLSRFDGALYQTLLFDHGTLRPGTLYTTPYKGLRCRVDPRKNELRLDIDAGEMEKCSLCGRKTLRKVKTNGNACLTIEDMRKGYRSIEPFDDLHIVQHLESRQVDTSSSKKAACGVTLKPTKREKRMVNVQLQWKDSVVNGFFQSSDISEDAEGFKESVKEVATKMLEKYFPDHVDNAELHRYVSKQISKVVKTQRLTDYSDSITVSDGEYSTKPAETITSQQVKDEAVKEESLSVNAIKPDDADTKPDQPPKIVKVVSTTGKQGIFEVKTDGITYSKLQKLIEQNLGIPASNQSIKMGFPPKELQVASKESIVPLAHGDRIQVEDCPNLSQKQKQSTAIKANTTVPENFRSYDNESANNNFRTAISELSRMPDSQQRDEMVWNVMKTYPSVFHHGGEVYKQISSQITHMPNHTSLPYLRIKNFYFTPHSDQVELCVKGLGHFMISGDIDCRIKQAEMGETVRGFQFCPDEAFRSRVERDGSSSPGKEGDHCVRSGPGCSFFDGALGSSKKKNKKNVPKRNKRNTLSKTSDVFQKADSLLNNKRISDSEESDMDYDDCDYDSM